MKMLQLICSEKFHRPAEAVTDNGIGPPEAYAPDLLAYFPVAAAPLPAALAAAAFAPKQPVNAAMATKAATRKTEPTGTTVLIMIASFALADATCDPAIAQTPFKLKQAFTLLPSQSS